MDLALNNLQRLICHKTQQTKPKHNKPWFTEECKNMIRECQATLRKFKKNPSSENLNKYKQPRTKT